MLGCWDEMKGRRDAKMLGLDEGVMGCWLGRALKGTGWGEGVKE